MTVTKLVNLLKQAGIEVLAIHHPTDVTDAGVDLVGNKDVQIAGRFFVVNQWVEEDQASWELGQFRNTADLINFLNETLYQ